MADTDTQAVQEACTALQTEIGIKCDSYLSLDQDGQTPYRATFYTRGICSGDARVSGRGDSFMDALANARLRWLEIADAANADTIKKMALEIIALTAEHGSCTDAQLRAEFGAGEVAKFGEVAVSRANEMASSGPFSITVLTGANDRAGEAQAEAA